MSERERPRETKANGRIPQQPMFDSIIQPSLPYIPIPFKTTIKDRSFSSYTNPEEPNNQLDDSELSIFDAQRYFNETGTDPKPSRRVSPVDSKVIGLDCIPERNDFSSVPRFSSASSSVGGHSYRRNFRTSSFHATPAASSEASWNSRTGLLTNPPGAISVSIRNPPATNEKRRGSSLKWFFGLKCPCYGRKSVQVKEKPSPRTPTRLNNRNKVSVNPDRQIPDRAQVRQERNPGATPHWLERGESLPSTHRISADNPRFPPPPETVQHPRVFASARPFCDDTNAFTFSILTKTSSPRRLDLIPPTIHNPSIQDLPRDSLEVFQPAEEIHSTKLKTTVSHPRRQSFSFPASPQSRTAIIEDDMASDASSDLFEIESFSTQSTSYPIHNHRRDSLDEASTFSSRTLPTTNAPNGGSFYAPQSVDEPVTPSVAATECYDPSGVSITWSMVTADGFDQGSNITRYPVTASEADYRTILRHQEGENMDGNDVDEKRRGGNGRSLSCRCEKAVSVGPQPVRIYGPEDGQRGVSTTLRHVRRRPSIVNNNYRAPPGRCHSSVPFAA